MESKEIKGRLAIIESNAMQINAIGEMIRRSRGKPEEIADSLLELSGETVRATMRLRQLLDMPLQAEESEEKP